MRKPTPRKHRSPRIDITEQIKVLFEEYQALYRLAEFRLNSLDRRALAAWAALTAFLTTFTALNSDAQWALLLGAPMALLWLLRTTINHARSFEDALRRLDEIECSVNELAGADLLTFQSRHPSRGGAVGGRTGTETVLTVLMTSIVMLGACGFLFYRHAPEEKILLYGYLAYLLSVACHYVSSVRTLKRYRYAKTRAELAAATASAQTQPLPSESRRTPEMPPSSPDRTPP